MVNVYIYLNSKEQAHEVALSLMEQNLAAHASIDIDNNSYGKFNGKIVKHDIYVLTLQTKALLFDKIVTFTIEKCGSAVKIFSLPITQCNETFGEDIRSNTERI
jgi:uncharacterized protein involved in tolerance to divalent cations